MTTQAEIDDRPREGQAGEPDPEKQPGHWLLARLGKRVLRPGGLELTETLLNRLDIGPADDVVEVGAGVGRTAVLLLERRPRSYTAVDPDEHAHAALEPILAGRENCRLVDAHAWATGLADGAATVVLGEAMLTMQSEGHKRAIMAEAFRALAPGGRYGIHELCLMPDDLGSDEQRHITRDLSVDIKAGARPVTVERWCELLRSVGFEITGTAPALMQLLEPRRLVADEGVRGAGRFALNVMRDSGARRRVLRMRAMFRRHADHLGAIAIVARRPDDAA
jgi:SAM-dependent methyltransferase